MESGVARIPVIHPKPAGCTTPLYHDAGLTIIFAGCRDDYRAGLRRMGSAELADETLDALVAAGEAVFGNHVLPDRHGIAAPGQPQFDGLPKGLAGTGSRTPSRTRRSLCLCFAGSLPARVGGHFVGRFCQFRVGGHPIGRFCRRLPSPTTRGSQRDSGCSQISARSLSADTGRPLNTPQRPSEPSQCYYLLFLFFASRHCSCQRRLHGLSPVSMSWVRDYRWPVFS